MAVVDTYVALDMLNGFDFSSLFNGSSYDRTSSSFSASYGDGAYQTITGYDFTYDNYGAPTGGGMVTGYAVSNYYGTFLSVSGINLPVGRIMEAALTFSTEDDFIVVTSVLSGDDVIWGSNDYDVLDGFNGNDSIFAYGGDDTIFGEAGNDLIDGGDGFDRIEGGSGADQIDGGGSDWDWARYINSNAGVTVSLATGVGTGGDAEGDRLSNIEILLGSHFADSLTGNGLTNVIYGDGGNDAIYGSDGDDWLFGDQGNDTLDGGVGLDRMAGGDGDDVYVVDSFLDETLITVNWDEVDETGSNGNDTIKSYQSFSLANTVGELENLTLLGSAKINGTGNALYNVLTGNAGDNVLSGAAGNDTLNGGAGNDTLKGGTGADNMRGGAGNDIYVVDHTSDIVNESISGSTGVDTIQSSISFSLANTARVSSVENLTLLGSNNINGTGNALNNVIIGNSGANVLKGGAGNDTLRGGAGADSLIGGVGNDVYIVDRGDKVYETGGQGTDTVYAAASFKLNAGNQVEILCMTTPVDGADNMNLWGNEFAQTIIGNDASNSLSGGGGNDKINGGGDNDTIYGGIGNDTLTGGAGADAFVFNTALNSASNVDRITDFHDDWIFLDNAVMPGVHGTIPGPNVLLDPTLFWKSTTGLAHDSSDRIIYETDTGWLNYDSNGNAAGGAVHIARLNPNVALNWGHFAVI